MATLCIQVSSILCSYHLLAYRPHCFCVLVSTDLLHVGPPLLWLTSGGLGIWSPNVYLVYLRSSEGSMSGCLIHLMTHNLYTHGPAITATAMDERILDVSVAHDRL